MKVVFFILILLIFGIPSCTQCLTNSNVSVVICPNKGDSLSVKYCPKCEASVCCSMGNIWLRSIDTNYSIIGFKLIVEKICSEPYDKIEGENIGARAEEVKWILSKACPGSLLKFRCIKAKDKTGQIHILNPLTLELK